MTMQAVRGKVSIIFDLIHDERCLLTMTNGATTQLTKTLKPICLQISRWEKIWWRASYRTLQRIGYIMTSSPMAMGMETPTNFPFCSAGPVSSTKLPSRTPMIMARMIQTARNRSSMPRDLNAETFFEPSLFVVCGGCFSISWGWVSCAVMAGLGALTCPFTIFLSGRSVRSVIVRVDIWLLE
jgi:hypothetical protein